MAEKKAFLLRLDASVFDALQKWAADDLRSANAQMEFLLRMSLREAGRLPSFEGPRTPEGEQGVDARRQRRYPRIARISRLSGKGQR